MNKEQLEDYKRKVAHYLREREAGMYRGQLDRLSALDLASDEDLIRKWSWKSAIVGIIASFAALPLGINVIGIFLPFELVQFLWAIDKVCMALTIVMFCVALYFTFRRNSSQ